MGATPVHHRIALIALRVILGIIFIQAAVQKAWVPDDRPLTIYDAYFPPGSARHWAFVGIEAAIGLWLISGIRARAAALVAMLVFLAFIGVLFREVLKTDPRLCGCGLESVEPDSIHAALWRAIGFDVLLLLGAAWLWFQSPSVSRPIVTENDDPPAS